MATKVMLICRPLCLSWNTYICLIKIQNAFCFVFIVHLVIYKFPEIMERFEDLDDEDEMCVDELEEIKTTIEVPLHELSPTKLCCFDPFLDDPQTNKLKPGVLKDYLEGSSETSDTEEETGQSHGLDPSMYCKCGQCSLKPTVLESVCCKSINSPTEIEGNTPVLLQNSYILLVSVCIKENPIINMILHPEMLEISLRNIWNTEGYPLGMDQCLSNR